MADKREGQQEGEGNQRLAFWLWRFYGLSLVSGECAPVAQRIEQRFPKPRVGRSSRPRGIFDIIYN